MSLSVVGCRAQGLDSKRLHYHGFLAFADSERRIHNYVFQSHVFFGCEGGTTLLRLMCVHDYRVCSMRVHYRSSNRVRLFPREVIPCL